MRRLYGRLDEAIARPRPDVLGLRRGRHRQDALRRTAARACRGSRLPCLGRALVRGRRRAGVLAVHPDPARGGARAGGAERAGRAAARATRRTRARSAIRARSAKTARAQFWPIDEITRLLLRAAQIAPVVLLLDDLQWADSGTLQPAQLPRARAAVGAHPGDRDASRRAGAPASSAGSRGSRASPSASSCRGCASRTSASYIAQLTSASEAVDALARAVHRGTAGNALFVQETVRALIAEHGEAGAEVAARDARCTCRRWRATCCARRSRARPRRARAARRSRACSASVSSCTLLRRMLRARRCRALLDLIEAAQRHRLVVAETPTRYRFAHALIRTLLYDEMPTAERVVLHRKAALELETLSAVEPRHHEIALHYYRSLPAGEYDRVTAAARRAAIAAEAVHGIRGRRAPVRVGARGAGARPGGIAARARGTAVRVRLRAAQGRPRRGRARDARAHARVVAPARLRRLAGERRARDAPDVRDGRRAGCARARCARGSAARRAARGESAAHLRDEPAGVRAAVCGRHAAQQAAQRGARSSSRASAGNRVRCSRRCARACIH